MKNNIEIEIVTTMDDVLNFILTNKLTHKEQMDILNSLDSKYILPVDTLYDQLKFEVVRNLYNNMSLEELQNIEKNIKIKIL
jgi:mRNA degradation ribonuclease J1/J2